MSLRDRILAQLASDDAPVDVTMDEAYAYIAEQGYHVPSVTGYNPMVGGPPAYQVTMIAGDGSRKIVGDPADTLRNAMLQAALAILEL